MNNYSEIQESSFEVTLSASIRTPVYLKTILIAFFVAILCSALFIISFFESTETKTVLGLSCVAATLLFFVGRYIAWNLYGQEWIKVSTKSILYSRNYGLYNLPPKIITFNYIATNIETVKQYKEVEYGTINFYDRIPTTMQLSHKFSSTINIPVEQLKEFEEKIHRLFINNQTDFIKWLKFSQN
jgi:hypothetical protein